jgi:DNA mismatch endonuclease, patch repair protein
MHWAMRFAFRLYAGLLAMHLGQQSVRRLSAFASEKKSMSDTFTHSERSEIMRRVKSQKTTPELIVRRALREAGIKGFRSHNGRLPGRPDFSFAGGRVAVFVDGCFWHGCPECYRRPSSNRAYWDQKVVKNIARDRRSRTELRRRGWRVFRLWEHEVRKTTTLSRRLRSLALLTEKSPASVL